MTYRKTIDTIGAFENWGCVGVKSVKVSHLKDTAIETKPDSHDSIPWEKDWNRGEGRTLASICDKRMIDPKGSRVRVEDGSLHKSLLRRYRH